MIGGSPIVLTVRPSLHLNVQFRADMSWHVAKGKSWHVFHPLVVGMEKCNSGAILPLLFWNTRDCNRCKTTKTGGILSKQEARGTGTFSTGFYEELASSVGIRVLAWHGKLLTNLLEVLHLSKYTANLNSFSWQWRLLLPLPHSRNGMSNLWQWHFHSSVVDVIKVCWKYSSLSCCWIPSVDTRLLEMDGCCIKWLSMVSNNKSTNNTASIVTTWCLYCRTKLTQLFCRWLPPLVVVPPSHWCNRNWKPCCLHVQRLQKLETKIVLNCFVATHSGRTSSSWW
jgi:hypothetical protein